MRNLSINKVLLIITVILFVFFAVPAKACHKKTFKVSAYGLEKEAIAKLVSDVNRNKGGRILFPENDTLCLAINDDFNSGHKLLPQESSTLFLFKDCEFLDIDLNGSTIVLEDNHSSKYALFCFYNCSSFSLRNGVLIGDAESHDYSPVFFMGKKENSSHEWGHGIMVVGSKGELSDLCVSNMCGDGIYVTSYKHSGAILDAKLSIKNCEIGYCRRNGITSASTIGFQLSDSFIHHIGSYGGLSGTDPRAGVDFEYEDDIWNKGDILISGCSFWDCEKKTITSSNTFAPDVISFEVDNCSFSGSIFQISNLLSKKGKRVKNCQFKEAPIHCGDALVDNCVFYMGSKLYYVDGTTFRRCSFYGTVSSITGPYGCAIVGGTLEPAFFINCSFVDIRGVNNMSPAYQGISGYNFPLTASFQRCSFKNTSFVKGNPKHDSSFHFDKCVLTDGCMIYNEGGSTVDFLDSKIDNVESYLTQTGTFSFDNCEIIQNDASIVNPLLFFGTHEIKKNCKVINTLTITPRMRALGVHGIRYKE